MKKILLMGIVFILLSSFVFAAPPFEDITGSDKGLLIRHPPFETIKQSQDFKFHIHVFNESNGLLMTPTQNVSCYLHLYDHNGSHFLKENLSFEVPFDYDLFIGGGNFSRIGFYSFVIDCTTIEFGGSSGGLIEVTKDGKQEQPLNTLALVVAGCLIAFLFLYFAFQLSEDHFLFKLLLIFLFFITLMAVPYIAITGAKSYDSLLKITLWAFRLFITYFAIYIFWHWFKKSEVMLNVFNRK